METLLFSILIKADKPKVWNTMLNESSYRMWTKEFHEGSYYEGSWEKGSEIRFIAVNKEGKVDGIYSRIKDNIPFTFISIQHLGTIANGIVDTTSEEVKAWAPSLENYSFIETSKGTEIKVEMQVEESFRPMFEEMWPRALRALKRMCEN